MYKSVNVANNQGIQQLHIVLITPRTQIGSLLENPSQLPNPFYFICCLEITVDIFPRWPPYKLTDKSHLFQQHVCIKSWLESFYSLHEINQNYDSLIGLRLGMWLSYLHVWPIVYTSILHSQWLRICDRSRVPQVLCLEQSNEGISRWLVLCTRHSVCTAPEVLLSSRDSAVVAVFGPH